MLKINTALLKDLPLSPEDMEELNDHEKQKYMTQDELKIALEFYRKGIDGEYLYAEEAEHEGKYNVTHIQWFMYMLQQTLLDHFQTNKPDNEFMIQLEIGFGEDGFFITRIPTEKLLMQELESSGNVIVEKTTGEG